MRENRMRVSRAKGVSMLDECEIERLIKLRHYHIGESCWIIGNGPSINKTDLLKLKDKPTFVANSFVTHKDFFNISPTYYVATNPRFLQSEFLIEDALPVLRASKTTVFLGCSAKHRIVEKSDSIYFLDTTESPLFVEAGYNLDVTKTLLGTRVSVIIQAIIPLAIHMGFKDIYLVGCDCDYGNLEFGKTHFFGFGEGYPNLRRIYDRSIATFPQFYQGRENTSKLIGEQSNEEYLLVYRKAAELGVKIYNCTVGGKLDVIPRIEFEAATMKLQENRF